MNGEQYGDERHDPSTIGSHPGLLISLDAGSNLGQPLGTIETDIGNDGLVDVELGVPTARS